MKNEIDEGNHETNIYEPNKDILENHACKSIEPYLDALSFFTKIETISNEFNQKYLNNNSNPNLPKFKSINEFIEFFIKNSIRTKNGDDPQKKTEKAYLRKNPHKTFCFLLDELHKIFKYEKNNQDENKDKIKAVEYDSQVAKQLFKDYMKHDKSDISELFFGQKKIIKYCKSCNLTQYIYKYIKVIPLTISSSQDTENNLGLDMLFSKIEEKFSRKYFCSMCSSMQDFNVVIKISKKPKILIVIILNNYKEIKVKIENSIFNNEYKLIAAEIGSKKSKNVLSSIFGCFSRNRINYKIIYDNNEQLFNLDNTDKFMNDDAITTGNPYVLFYKRDENINEKLNDSSIDKGVNDDLLISFEKEDENKQDSKQPIKNNSYNQQKVIYSYNNNIKKKYNNSINYNNNNMYNSKDKKEIILYFTLKSNGKEIFIDTDDCKTFSDIVVQIIEKYEWAVHKIDENKLFFNNKKIDCRKTPKQLGIVDESRIIVHDI